MSKMDCVFCVLRERKREGKGKGEGAGI